ncbi:PEP/pyruvate-binding domain-containing protein [Salinispira pacifica]
MGSSEVRKQPQFSSRKEGPLAGECTATTGVAGLDEVLTGLRPGDNLVWRVDSIDHYTIFAKAALKEAVACGISPVYFRFASHPSIADGIEEVSVQEVQPRLGFEHFITQIHQKIKSKGRGGLYIFDSLSELSNSIYSDRMIGNFFSLTCPLLRDLDAIAYFVLYRYFHSYHATTPIITTTQILLDVYLHRGTYFVQPIKVSDRSSATMFMLHRWDADRFVPVKESGTITEVTTATPWPGLPSASYRMIGVWDKTFMLAESVQNQFDTGAATQEQYERVFHRVLELIISREPPMRDLAARYFTLKDVIEIWKRMIGTGMIGGKSVGMLLARAILSNSDARWKGILEKHDSFFIGSDVFYTFLVQNDCWWARQQQKDPESFLKGTEAVRRRILRGRFAEYIVARFNDMLDYFGPFPIIVRSSSLLEDNFGNAFAGKYESVFCTNQGTKAERLREFMQAVRIIYASTMSPDALVYRKTRGVLDKDEQMALLVQRVSGRPYGPYYFPQIAGVGFSVNPYRWHKDIDPDAGMLRLVFGLGTRAVNRSDDDYTRVVALNAPEKHPQASMDDVRRYTQHRVDLLDLDERTLSTVDFAAATAEFDDAPAELFASRDRELERRARQMASAGEAIGSSGPGDEWTAHASYRLLTFEGLFRDTSFVSDMRSMMRTLKEAYGTHVDIEFTANFSPDGSYLINLVQCRPLQVQLGSKVLAPLPEIPPQDLIIKAYGGVVGHSRMLEIDTIIYVVPELYGVMPEQERYALARLVGKVVHSPALDGKNIILIGPGRWGTSTPSLGVPVSFAEINRVAALCEIDSMHEGLSPDLSLGTHFFNELVEMNMLYVACFTGEQRNVFNTRFLLEMPNELAKLAVNGRGFADSVRIIRSPVAEERPLLYLNVNSVEQVAALYRGD